MLMIHGTFGGIFKTSAMIENIRRIGLIFILFFPFIAIAQQDSLKTGADQPEVYLPLLNNKNVALVINQTSVVNKESLADFLLSKNIKVKTMQAPDPGSHGGEDDGETVHSSTDVTTGPPFVLMYCQHKKHPA